MADTIIDLVNIKELCISGLRTDAAHHKQWYFEQILEALGLDLRVLSMELYGEETSYYWEESIPP